MENLVITTPEKRTKGFMKNPFSGQIATFDCTVKLSEFGDYRSVASELNKIAKHWCFQHEKGEETDYEHWQIRLSLHKKTRFEAFSREVMPVLPGYWSSTSAPVHAGNQFNYVMKAQTRVSGPWTDKDKDLRPPPVITKQLTNFLQKAAYPWQTAMWEHAQTYNERQIMYVYDPHYNSGKSVFAEWLEYKGLAEEIPPFQQMEDIMEFVMCQPVSSCYVIDMPAAMPKDKMRQMYSGIEMLKNGFLYDKRYNGKKRRIDRPQIMVFANQLPDTKLMAPDRWMVYYIQPDKQLVAYSASRHPLVEGERGFDPA